MKGQHYLSLDNVTDVCAETVELDIPAVMIFGILKQKDADGSVALKRDGLHPRIFRTLKREFGDDLVVISNICLCDFTADEYCVYTENGKVLNEKTSEMLGRIAVVHAEAGADVVAPAAMSDGQVRHMRSALDEAGFEEVAVMSNIKTDSCLFEPFFHTMSIRETPRVGVDSSKFRTDIINEKIYMRKIDLDIGEGADMVIVKPALTNLDLILRTTRRHPTIPVAAYQVSGEYAMIRHPSREGYLDEGRLVMETLSSIKRAGADMILTYYAREAARYIAEGRWEPPASA